MEHLTRDARAQALPISHDGMKPSHRHSTRPLQLLSFLPNSVRLALLLADTNCATSPTRSLGVLSPNPQSPVVT
jgi:hypothetical protein